MMQNAEIIFKTALKKHVPERSLDYCHWLWYKHNFTLKIKKKRASRLGDYRYDPGKKQHTISVNNDLNPFSFLVTYIHEVAHLVTFCNKKNVKPHGEEWKKNFKALMLPVLNSEVFPTEVLSPLVKYLKNPKASSCNDHSLMRALRTQDTNLTSLQLNDINPGKLFKFNNRIFRKENLKRTRYVCCEVASKRKYLISRIAEVEPV